MFTQSQIQELMSIVDYHSAFVVASVLGGGSLSDFDKFILAQNGIDVDKLSQGNPPHYAMYLWGKLSSELSSAQASSVEFDDFKKYVQRGQYVPLSKNERIRYELSRQVSYNHLKGLSGKQKQTITNIISSKISEGLEKRKTLKGIVSDIGHEAQTWERDWGRIVDTEMNNIFQQGRSQAIKEKSGADAIVFKDVYDGACRHCISKYLTNGIGSQPRLFKLADLEANGSNVGRKVADWQPTVNSMHPQCRCTLRELPKNFAWDEEKAKFAPKRQETTRTAKARLVVGDKEYFV